MAESQVLKSRGSVDGRSGAGSFTPDAESVADAARRAGVSRTLFYELIAAGEVATIKLGKRRLVRVEETQNLLKRLERRAA